jgi:hypothetical protein
VSRGAFVQAALALVGLTEPSPELGALVDPAGDPSHQGQIERLSLCMLTARGLWLRVLDIPDDISRADQPYRPGTIPAILGAILGNAARTPTIDTPPQAGDGLWWVANGPHVEHVDACVASVGEPVDASVFLYVVAGGQRDATGHETIAQLTRTIQWDGRAWVCQATGRHLRWILDADVLESHYGMRDAEEQ